MASGVEGRDACTIAASPLDSSPAPSRARRPRAGPGDEVEQVGRGGRIADDRDRVARGRVLQPQVHPDFLGSGRADVDIRPDQHDVGADVLADALQRVGAKLSASESPSSIFMRATFSPGMVRSRSPALSSVVNISPSAVDSQALSARPERFLKPSTATDRRILVEDAAEDAADRSWDRSQPRAPQPAPITSAAIAAAAPFPPRAWRTRGIRRSRRRRSAGGYVRRARRALDVGPHRVEILVALRRFLLERLVDDRDNRGIEARTDLRERRRRLEHDLADHRERRVSLERLLIREQLIADRADRVDVAAMVRVPHELFRGHVVGRADALRESRDVGLQAPRDAEVDDLQQRRPRHRP